MQIFNKNLKDRSFLRSKINLKKPDYPDNYYENASLNKGGVILPKEDKETSFQPEPIPEPEPEPVPSPEPIPYPEPDTEHENKPKKIE